MDAREGNIRDEIPVKKQNSRLWHEPGEFCIAFAEYAIENRIYVGTFGVALGRTENS